MAKKKAAKKVSKPAAKKQAVVKTKAAVKTKAGKYVYHFGRKTDGNGTMKPLLGGKGANLAEMCRIGLPVPPGFTITTDVCTYYYANKRTYPSALKAQMQEGIALQEKQTVTRSSIYESYKSMVLYEAIEESAERGEVVAIRNEPL